MFGFSNFVLECCFLNTMEFKPVEWPHSPNAHQISVFSFKTMIISNDNIIIFCCLRYDSMQQLTVRNRRRIRYVESVQR